MAYGTVLLRHVFRGRVWGALPTVVVKESPEQVVLWLPEGTAVGLPESPGRQRPVPVEWDVVVRPWVGLGPVMVIPRFEAHAIWHLWHPDGSFRCWYVNLQEPLRPTPLGFDTMDQALDLIAYPNGSWEWKDEDELAEQVEAGCFTPGDAAAVRAEGERVLANWPFPTGWEHWQPEPGLPAPRLPDGWDAVSLAP